MLSPSRVLATIVAGLLTLTLAIDGGPAQGTASTPMATLPGSAAGASWAVSPLAHEGEYPDGSSADRAAASCWDIKQHDPAASSGNYWLLTPTLQAPQQFYCDQETDGGGWVLIARGREGWWTSHGGRGTPQALRQNPTGVTAFDPVQLPVATINGLLNGGRVDQLDDGIRLRRATNTSGTAWQEVRFRYSSPRATFSWQFNNAERIGQWQVGSSSGSGGSTAGFGSGSLQNVVDTRIASPRPWQGGFGYGSAARGSTASDSYVWAPSSTSGYPRPFTQMWLRPKLGQSDLFSAIPETGTDAISLPSRPDRFALPAPWGVAGLGAAGNTELSTEVAAFEERDGVMFVGGNFTSVQRNAAGLDRVNQSYLAAFDSGSGEWIPGFRPTFDNQVKSLAVLPDGNLAVGGDFQKANGAPATGFVVLNPATGATVSAYTTQFLNRVSGTGPPSIKSMSVHGNHLYVGGRFTHITSTHAVGETYSRNLARLSLPTGAPDGSWAVVLDGTVMSVHASEQGDRAYAAGYFGYTNWDTQTRRAGAYDATTAEPLPWTPLLSSSERSGYQQAVREIGDRVWLGGSEHSLFSYARDDLSLVSTNITETGGDFQAIATWGGDNGVVAGCHCAQTVYEGARTWPSITDYHNAESINEAGLWDAATGAYLPEFSPVLSTRRGAGAWALQTSGDGTLWVGGDFTAVRRPNGSNQWTGGFVRFAPTDADPPAAPKNFVLAETEDQDVLNWASVSGAARYEVLRHDRVVHVTAATQVELPAAPDGTNYFVRAVDATGNRSASAAAVTTTGQRSLTVVSAGSEWSYWWSPQAPAAGWQQPGYDDSVWSTGTAPVGWGQAGLATVLTRNASSALTSYYRRGFTVDDVSQVSALAVSVRVDDGVAVYLNGQEVRRANLPQGPVGHGTYATAAPGAAAVTSPLVFEVPGNLVQEGENVLTVEVHSNWRSTPSHSFELSAELVPETDIP